MSCKIQQSILLAIVLIFLTGCATINHKPPLDIPAPPYIPPNYAGNFNPICIKDYTDANTILTGRVLSLTFKANLSEYGDALIALLKRELIKNGVQVSQDSHRIVGVAVSDVEIVFPMKYRCDLNIAIKIGGETVGIAANSTIAGFYLPKIIDSAIADAVRKILQNGKFVAYITKAPQLSD